MDTAKAWFVQRKRWQRPLIASWQGAVAGGLFVVAFFAIAALFLSLQPFEPLNFGLLGLWWLTILTLMLGFHLFARRRTFRVWEQGEPSATGKTK